MKTAVEFYAEQEVKLTLDFISNKLNELEYGIKRIELLKQAKEMEKAEKIEAKIQGLYLASTDAMGISYRIMELEEELKSLTFKSE